MEAADRVAVDISTFRPLIWSADSLRLIDQTRLPTEEIWLECRDYASVVAAISEMRVRGAPAIGLAGAYAMVLAAQNLTDLAPSEFHSRLTLIAEEIAHARPTAVNLSWAVERMLARARNEASFPKIVDALEAEAIRMHEEDIGANRRIGRLGADLLGPESAVLTHCNAGALATGGFGTALGIVRCAWADGKLVRVFATETRPFLQGSRLTAWELARAGIDTAVLPDSAAGQLLRSGAVSAVIVGADRIAANGDVANKIGTYALSVLAQANGVPLYVAAPTSTVDLSVSTGDEIPIESRPSREVTHAGGAQSVPDGVDVLNPAFDITPHENVSAFITENGVLREPYDRALAGAVGPQ